MKIFQSASHVTLFSLLLTLGVLGACSPSGEFDTPQIPAVSGKPNTKPNETAPTPGAVDPQKKSEEEAYQEKARARAETDLSSRAQALQVFDSKVSWNEKLEPAMQFMTSLEYQQWRPFENAHAERDKREELFSEALAEYFTLWSKYASELGEQEVSSVVLSTNKGATQSLIALALAMDSRNPEQDALADQYGFDKFSIFGMIRDTLIKGHARDSDKSFEQTVQGNETTAKQALEWRVSAKYQIAYQMMQQSKILGGGGLFSRSSMNLAAASDGDLQSITRKLQTANIGYTQLAKIKGRVVVADSVRASFQKLKLDGKASSSSQKALIVELQKAQQLCR